MANATKRGNVGQTPFGDYETLYGAVSTAQIFYPNALVGLNASGYLDKLDDTAIKRFVGVMGGVEQEVLSGGSNGDVLIPVKQPRFVTLTFSSIALANLGQLVYASDDQTGSLTPGTYGNLIGKLVYVINATTGVVQTNYFGEEAAAPLQVLSGDGAIQIKSGAVMITKGSIAAITIAAPTAGADDGKTIEAISTTAFAHVVTSGTVGFNAKGSSGTATYGAAKGNSFRIKAYQGNWYVDGGLNGVTIA